MKCSVLKCINGTLINKMPHKKHGQHLMAPSDNDPRLINPFINNTNEVP